MKKLFAELKYRRIWRTLVAYPSVAFVLLQVVEFFINNYALDARLLTATIIAAVGFLPLALVWNWMHGEVGRRPFRKSEVAAYVVISAPSLGLVDWYWTSNEPEFPGEPTELARVLSIALMPFENPGENADVQYLCDGIVESLINWLAGPSVRADPRYLEILRQLNFPPTQWSPPPPGRNSE